MNRLNDQVNVMLSNQSFFNKRTYLYTAIITAFIIIATVFFIFRSFQLKTPNQPEQNNPASQPSPIDKAKLVPVNQEIDSTIAKIDENIITIASGSKVLTYNITSSTQIYKCTDFNNMNDCKLGFNGLKSGTAVKIFTKELDVLYLYTK